jgi:hypothetical protein
VELDGRNDHEISKPIASDGPGLGGRRGFDRLPAERMDAGGTKEDAIQGLAGLTGNCVGCHATYRLDEAR